MSVVRGPLDEMIAVHTVDGFVVVESSPSLVTLERKNPWLSVVVGAVIGAIGGGMSASPRRERVYLHVEDGVAVARLTP